MNAKEAAQKVFNKLENMTSAEMLIAVFRKGEDVQMTKPTTELFTLAQAKRPNDLAGVYDRTARLDWIEQDLIACGMEA